VDPQFTWRGEVSDRELFDLTRSYGGASQTGWWDQIRPYSLGWVTARLGGGSDRSRSGRAGRVRVDPRRLRRSPGAVSTTALAGSWRPRPDWYAFAAG